jgi:DivIVA domain-containing protein
VNLIRVVIVVLILLGVFLLFVRVIVPYARRVVDRSDRPTVVPGAVVPDAEPGGLPLTTGHGYDRADVEELLDRVYGLADAPSGREEALALVRSARFHMARRGGYQPVFVDDVMDRLADALANDRDLPPRPDQR